MFAFYLILQALHFRKPTEHWSANLQSQSLFVMTKAYAALSDKRSEQGALICQLRRWLPLCKALAQKARRQVPTMCMFGVVLPCKDSHMHACRRSAAASSKMIGRAGC